MPIGPPPEIGSRFSSLPNGFYPVVLAVYSIPYGFLAVWTQECQDLAADALNGQDKQRQIDLSPLQRSRAMARAPRCAGDGRIVDYRVSARQWLA
jgi:hypothetical protein